MAVTPAITDNASMPAPPALPPDGSSSIEDVADRVAMLREVLRFDTQVQFAERLGIEVSALNHIESARRLPSLQVANRMRLLYRIPLDFLYHGDRSGLSVEVASSIPFLADWRADRGGKAASIRGRPRSRPPRPLID